MKKKTLLTFLKKSNYQIIFSSEIPLILRLQRNKKTGGRYRPTRNTTSYNTKFQIQIGPSIYGLARAMKLQGKFNFLGYIRLFKMIY